MGKSKRKMETGNSKLEDRKSKTGNWRLYARQEISAFAGEKLSAGNW
jgi:hypothetical protein